MIPALWVLAAASAAAYLGVAGAGLGGPVRAVKVVPALALAALVGARWPVLGLGFGFYAAGDALLLDKGRLFLPGLVAFLAGHLVFLGYIPRIGGEGWSTAGLLGGGVVAVAMCLALWPGLRGPLKVAVPVYASALAGVLAVFAPLGGLGAGGALLFLLSDALLAWQKFRGPLPGLAGPRGELAVLGTYYAAIALMGSTLAGLLPRLG